MLLSELAITFGGWRATEREAASSIGHAIHENFISAIFELYTNYLFYLHNY